MTKNSPTLTQLKQENESLREQLAEAQRTLRDLQSGASQFLMISGGLDEPIYNAPGGEHLYRLLVEQMGEGAATLSADGVILYANHRLASMLGVPLERVTGTSLFTWLAPSEQERIQTLLQKSDGHVSRVEVAFQRGDEALLPASLSMVRLADATLPVISLIATDLSEQRQREINLHNSEARFRQMFNKHDAIMLLIEPGAGAIIDANLAAERFYGYSREQLRWMKIDQINILPPEEVAAMRKQAARQSLNFFVFPHRLASGEVRMVEVHSSPIQVNEGVVLFSIIYDVTERKLVEEKLRESEKTIQVVFNAVAESLFLMDIDGKIITANATTASRLGKQVSDLVGANIYDLIPPEIIPTRKEWAAKAVREQQGVHFEDFRFNKWIENNIYPIVDEDGQVRRLAIFGRDVTERKQAEESLRTSEEKFSKVFQSSSALIAIAEASTGNYVEVNDAWLRTMEYSREEVIGRPPSQLGVFADLDQYYGAWQALHVQGSLQEHEITIRAKSGKIVYGVFSADWIEVQGKRFLITVTNDITERKRAEEIVAENTRQMTALVTSLDDIVFEFDEQGIYLNVWATDESKLVQPKEQLLGRRITDALGEELGRPLEKAVKLAITEGVSTSLEYPLQMIGGQAWFMAHFNPVVTRDGSHRTASMLVRDITERKQAEEKLRKSEERFRTMYATSPDAIGLFDADANIVLMNPAAAKVFGYSSSDAMKGINALEFFMPEDRISAAQVINQIFTTGMVRNVEFKLLRQDGSYFTSEFSCSALYGVDAKPEGFLAVTRDITERKQVEQALHESEEKYRLLTELSPVAIAIHVDGKLEMVNAAGLRTFGGTSERDFIGKSIFEFIHPDWIQPVIQRVSHALQEGQTTPQEEMLFKRLDGREINVLVTSTPITYLGKAAMLSAVVDITENKRVKADLFESEQKFATTFQISPVGMMVTRRSDGKFLELNGEMERISGYSRAEMLGQSVAKMGLFADPDLRQKLATQGVLRDVELKVKHKTGEWRWISLSAQPIKLQGEECFLVIIRDIHEKKLFEDEKRQSEAKFRALLYNSPMQSVIWKFIRDAQGTIMDWEIVDINPLGAASIGLEIEAAPGRRALDLFGPEVMASYLELSRQIDATGQPVQFETHFQSNNKYYWSSDFLLGDDLYAIVSVDITALKMAQAEVESVARFPSENPHPVLRLDRAGVIQYANKASDLLLRDWKCTVGDHAPAFWQEQVADTFSRQSNKVFEVPSGDLTYMATLTYVSQADYINLYLSDITQLKRAEQQLQTALNELEIERSLLRQLIDNLPDLIFLKDRESRFLVANQATAAFMGAESPESLLGHTDFDFYPEPLAQQYRLAEQQVMESGESIIGFERPQADIHKRDHWLSATKLPLRDPQGQVIGLVGIERDVTARKQVELELRASEEKFSAAFRVGPLALSITDSDARHVDVNDALCDLFGYSREEIIGKTASELGILDQAEIDNIGAQIKRATGIMNGLEVQMRSRDGRIHDMLYSVSPIMLNNTAHYLGTALDITERKQAERSLQESQSNLRRSQEAAHLGHWTWDFQTNRVIYSDEMFHIYGLDAADFDGDPYQAIRTVVHPEDREVMFKIGEAVARGENPAPLEYRVIWPDGSQHIIYTEVSEQSRDEQGNISKVWGIAQDITERKEAQRALSASEERYRGLIESMDTVVSVFDAEGRLIYLNQVAAKQFGGTVSGMIGKTMRELFPEPTASRQLEAVQHVFHEDQALTVESVSMIQGQPRWYRTSIQPLHDENGKVTFVLINATDIHDLKAAQQELLELNRTLEERVKERTAQVQDLYDNAPVGYHSLDKDGRIVAVNQTELNWLGYTREEMLGRHAMEFFSEQEKSVFAEVFPRFIATGSMTDLEFESVRKDGSVFPVTVSATAIYDADGNFLASRTTLVDITERKRAEVMLQSTNAELERAMRVKDEFLAGMSHELRTPLTGILGISEILLSDLFGQLNERQNKYVQIIDTSGRHLLSLINDILDLSKVEAGKLEPHFEVVSVNDICQTSMSFVKQSALNKQVRLSLVREFETLSLVADPVRLKQILINLLGNAVKFAPDGSEVTLRVDVDKAAQKIMFAVSDNGIGISAEDMAKLFKPFTQLDSSLSRKYEGTGLGLALVKKLVDLHNGTVTVQSEVGQGSTFTVTLPWLQVLEQIQPAKLSTASLIPLSAPGTEKNTNKLILLAEDNDVNVNVVKDFLEHLGYNVIRAAHGGEVLPMIEKHHPDVVLMDVQMPVMDGLEATRLIRSKPEYKDLPIIAVTALAMSGDEELCFAAGATEYFSKPYSLANLAIVIEKLLKQGK